MLSSLKKAALALVFFSLFAACSQDKNSLSGFYGADINYFNALNSLKEEKPEAAQKYFLRSAKKGSYWIARRSTEQLCLMGDIQQRIKKCLDFVKQYDDDDAKFFVCREFMANREYALVIESTDGIDLAECDNALAALRLQALNQKNDSRFDQSVYDWFTQRRISDIHYEFYRQNARDELEEIISGEDEEAPKYSDFIVNMDFILQFRIAIYRGNYNAAYEMLEQIRALTVQKKSVPLTWQLVADMGRACVNGNDDNIKNARWFAELAQSNYWDGDKIKYYAMIYSGLLYNKDDNYRRRSLKQFESALSLAGDDNERDQALWYYLQSCLKISTEEAVAGLQKYAASFSQKEYFDDFFDSLSVLLFSGGKWDLFEKVYDAIKDYASQATVSKYAYLTARILQTQIKDSDENKIKSALQKAVDCDPGTFVYYKLLAANELGYSTESVDKMFFAPKNLPPLVPEKMSQEETLSARKLLLGYADFGFGEMIYDEWKFFFDMDSRIIDLETVVRLSSFLRQMANGQNDYYSKSLRMISRSANLDGIQISKKAFELLYPRNFMEQVQESAKEFEVDDHLMFALIRTESFFEPKIQSHAGAIGLTQLMEATASDCAKKLKVEEYNLLDPATNIRFGTYYYSHVKRRLNDSGILALFAYNAGITTVRRWIRSSKIELNSQKQLWSDMFLETLPFAETRGYGRRVVSAAAMYAYLYGGKNPCQIVNEIM